MRLLLLFLFILSLAGGTTVKEYTLKNGVKVILKETKGRGIVSGVILVKGGLYGEDKKGVTSLLFTLLLKGTKSYPDASSLSLPFEKYGGYIYSSSGDDFSEIGFSTKLEGLEEALDVIKEVLTIPLLREEDLRKEKKNQIMALRSKLERGMSYAYEELRELTYKGTPYETSPLGKEEDIKAITTEDLRKRLTELVRGENVVVALVGDFNAEEVFPLIEEAFSRIPEGSFKINEVQKPIEKDEVKRVKREGTQATILCAFNAPPRLTKEYFAFKVFNSLLGEGMTSRLFRRLREEKGYAYATYSFYPTRLSAPRLFAYVGTSPEKKEEALRDLLLTVKDGNVTEQEVELAKKKLVGDFLLDHQTRLRQAWYLAFFEVMGFGWEMDSLYTENIKKVSKEDVEKVIEKYINHHHCVIVEP